MYGPLFEMCLSCSDVGLHVFELGADLGTTAKSFLGLPPCTEGELLSCYGESYA